MRHILCLLLVLIPFQASAKAPECPLYSNKQACLTAVQESHQNYMDFLYEEYPKEERPPELIQAANDIKHFEMLACQKTCLN